MSVESDDLRRELRTTARGLLDQHSPAHRVLELAEASVAYDPVLLDQMAELGWWGIHVPEAFGGAGAGFGDLAVVLTELGSHVATTPVLSSAVLATTALVHADAPAVLGPILEDIIDGTRRATVALTNTRGQCAWTRWEVEIEAVGGGYQLDGSAGFVLDGVGAEVLIVGARSAAGPVFVVVDVATPGVSVLPARTVDLSRHLATVTLDCVRVGDEALLTELDAGEALAGVVLDAGALGVAADSLGVAEQSMRMAASYATVREQFGRAIGSFQAIKHYCADMFVAVECGRAALDDALDRFDSDPYAPATSEAISIAKSYIGDASASVSGNAVQVHGGIGFTWEHDIHLYLKRAKLNQALMGSSTWHRRRIADLVLPRQLHGVEA